MHKQPHPFPENASSNSGITSNWRTCGGLSRGFTICSLFHVVERSMHFYITTLPKSSFIAYTYIQDLEASRLPMFYHAADYPIPDYAFCQAEVYPPRIKHQLTPIMFVYSFYLSSIEASCFYFLFAVIAVPFGYLNVSLCLCTIGKMDIRKKTHHFPWAQL
jgi:hypothetical protein